MCAKVVGETEKGKHEVSWIISLEYHTHTRTHTHDLKGCAIQME